MSRNLSAHFKLFAVTFPCILLGGPFNFGGRSLCETIYLPRLHSSAQSRSVCSIHSALERKAWQSILAVITIHNRHFSPSRTVLFVNKIAAAADHIPNYVATHAEPFWTKRKDNIDEEFQLTETVEAVSQPVSEGLVPIWNERDIQDAGADEAMSAASRLPHIEYNHTKFSSDGDDSDPDPPSGDDSDPDPPSGDFHSFHSFSLDVSECARAYSTAGSEGGFNSFPIVDTTATRFPLQLLTAH